MRLSVALLSVTLAVQHVFKIKLLFIIQHSEKFFKHFPVKFSDFLKDFLCISAYKHKNQRENYFFIRAVFGQDKNKSADKHKVAVGQKP